MHLHATATAPTPLPPPADRLPARGLAASDDDAPCQNCGKIRANRPCHRWRVHDRRHGHSRWRNHGRGPPRPRPSPAPPGPGGRLASPFGVAVWRGRLALASPWPSGLGLVARRRAEVRRVFRHIVHGVRTRRRPVDRRVAPQPEELVHVLVVVLGLRDLVVESLADFEERVDGQQRIRAGLVHGPDALCADVLADLLEATVEAVHPMDHELDVVDVGEI
mmetsp:Transcript_24273/g.55885  ORF Transcript_24273/g.55885 Transcript_24273/m.55885 type:complete len:220 (-) Transcript_24273:830-1489(-)